MLGLVVGDAGPAIGDLRDGIREGLGGLASKIAQVVRDGREGHRAVSSVGRRRGLGHGRALGGAELELELALGQAAALKDLGCREGLGRHMLRLVVVRERGVRDIRQPSGDLAIMGVDKLERVGGDVLGVRIASRTARNLARRVGNGLGASSRRLVGLDAVKVILRVAQCGELDGAGGVIGHLLAHGLVVLVKELERELPGLEPAALEDLLGGKHHRVVHAGLIAVVERGRQAGDRGVNLARAVIGGHNGHRMDGGVVGHASVGAGDLLEVVGVDARLGVGDGVKRDGAVSVVCRLADHRAVRVGELEAELTRHELGSGEHLLGRDRDAIGLGGLVAVLERGVVVTDGSHELALAVVGHVDRDDPGAPVVGPASLGALGLGDVEGVGANLGEGHVTKGDGLDCAVRDRGRRRGRGSAVRVADASGVARGERKVEGVRLGAVVAGYVLGHLENRVAGERDGFGGVGVIENRHILGNDGVITVCLGGGLGGSQVALAVVLDGHPDGPLALIVCDTILHAVRGIRRYELLDRVRESLGAAAVTGGVNAGKSVHGVGDGAKAHVAVGIVVPGDRKAVTIGLELELAVLERGAREDLTRGEVNCDLVGRVGVGDGGVVGRGGSHELALTVVGNLDRDLARDGVVGDSTRGALGLGDEVVVRARGGIRDVAKDHVAVCVVRDRCGLGHRRIGLLGGQREGELVGLEVATLEHLGSAQSGIAGKRGRLSRVGVGEGEARALNHSALGVDLLGDEVPLAVIRHLDRHRLSAGVIGHTGNGTGLGDGVDVSTRSVIRDGAKLDSAARLVGDGGRRGQRGALCCGDGELVLAGDVTGALEASRHGEDLLACDVEFDIGRVVGVLERKAIRGVVDLRAERAVTLIGNHNVNREGIAHGAHAGRQARGVLVDAVAIDVGAGR